MVSMGRMDQAREWMERALSIDPEDTHIRYNAACMWAQMGETEIALDLLERWASYVGRENLDWMQNDPDLDSIRGEARFQKVVELIDAKITERLGL